MYAPYISRYHLGNNEGLPVVLVAFMKYLENRNTEPLGFLNQADAKNFFIFVTHLSSFFLRNKMLPRQIILSYKHRAKERVKRSSTEKRVL